MTQTGKNRIKVLIPILICLIGMTGIWVYGINHYRKLSFQHISNLCQTIIESHPEAEEEVLSSLKEYSEGANQGEKGEEFLLKYGYRISDFDGGLQSGFIFLTFMVFLLLAPALLTRNLSVITVGHFQTALLPNLEIRLMVKAHSSTRYSLLPLLPIISISPLPATNMVM